MGTIDRRDGFRVVVNTDDHGVPHVHLTRGGAWAKIAIGDDTRGAYILDPKRMRESDLRDAVRLVDAHWEAYLKAREEIHG
ncbi:MAG TPA: DUF4160 domain-containing protein [Longimicrobiaceae bacterium]|nr:DUF4160 domain-containing protein [Longimicrobiaceae bacterium]